ncbi:MAG: hypothetical protein WDN08_15570 [Rhizomicrobium sp.]
MDDRRLRQQPVRRELHQGCRNTGDAFGIPTFIAGEPRFYGVSVSIRR